jgi:hypothetical protein
MEDITEDMYRFKEAVRHVWNAYLMETGSPMSPGLQDSFEKIERELLRALVLLPCGVPELADEYRRRPMPILIQAKSGLSEIPVQFGSPDANRNIKWELPCSVAAAGVSQYRFIEFFDWNPYGHVDMSYVKALTEDGRLALIEQMYCDFALCRA